MSRIDWYLQRDVDILPYQNTKRENEKLNKFVALYSMAKNAKESNKFAKSENINMWRKGYYGTLGALKKDGTESSRKSRQLRKMGYEFVESKVDNTIPQPKMMPRYKSDLPLVQVTEDYLRYNMNTIFTKYMNDRSERSTYVDGTSWYKVWWDSTSSDHNSSGEVKIDVCLSDQIVPQPGVKDWRKLQYIFELQQVSVATLWDLYHRRITGTASNTSMSSTFDDRVTDLSTVTVITCYYINDHGIVGRFAWAQQSQQVICDEEDWQIRKLRTCKKCGEVIPQAEVCPVCGSKSFEYKNAEKEILEEDLYVVYNPYDVGENDDETQKDKYEQKLFIAKGTEIPYYKIRMLPFVPRPAVSSIESIYGVSEIFILLEMQDVTNKMYTKMVDKTLASGAILTKPQRIKVEDTDDEGIKQLNVRTYEESQMIQNKQVMADTSQDIVAAQMLYDSAKASSGVTDSFQGKYDASATSGKAKQFAAEQTAGRIESLRVMKAAAFSGLYELVLKYLLAFSDDNQKFVKTLPNGSVVEQEWNRYMFLDKDEYGEIYYRDDFKFSSDPAATLVNNRVAMWQETQNQFIQGTFGNPADPRTMELFWNIMEQQQYPLAKLVLAGIKDNAQHLPAEIEQLLLQNPNVLQTVIQQLQDANLMAGGSSGQGGARPNSGPDGNGATHAANVERTNSRNRAAQSEISEGLGKTL